MIWEVKVGMYFLGGFGATIRKYPRAKQSLDSNTNSLYNLRFSICLPNFEIKKLIFFRDMKISMKCALVMNYYFRKPKIDPKHSFLMKYHDSGHFRPNE